MRRVAASLQTLAPSERLPEAALPPKEGNLSALLLEAEAPAAISHDAMRATAMSLVARFFRFGTRG
ncbi:MAG TPA: hypothetical protein VLV50_08950 [Stellaceae bacterium]|nr:hypothetical protein [Stellaceae bacterium]